MRTIVTAAFQRQYLQTDLALWICLVQVTIALTLIHTLYNSLQQALCPFIVLCLHRFFPVMASNAVTHSASLFRPLLTDDCLAAK
jgi:hypothetical protein